MSETNDAPLAEGDVPESIDVPEVMGTRIITPEGEDRWIPYNPTIAHCADLPSNTMYFPVAHDGGDGELALTHENCTVRIDLTEDYIVLGVQVRFS